MTAVFDVIVDNPELSVLGPPTQVDVAIDIGQQGIRGSKIFSGSGDPNGIPALSSQNLIDSDLFLRVDSNGANAGWLYKYEGTTWNPLLRLQPIVYSTSYDVSCSAGTGTISIPLTSIIPTGITTPPASNFIVSMTPSNTSPVVFSIVNSSKAISGSNFEFQVIARVYNTSATGYADLFTVASGTLRFDLRITVV